VPRVAPRGPGNRARRRRTRCVRQDVIARGCHPQRLTLGAVKMLDVILVALGLILFALSVGYAYACESL